MNSPLQIVVYHLFENDKKPSVNQQISGLKARQIAGSGLATYLMMLFLLLNSSVFGQWDQIASMSQERVQFGAVASEDAIYVWAGGIEGACAALYTMTANMEIYDKSTGVWSPGPDFPVPNWGMASAMCSNGLIYSIGGHADANYSFDPSSGIWSPIASPPVSNWEGAAAAGCEEMIHVFGGTSNPTGHFIYNTLTDTWAAGPSMPVGMNQHAAIAVGDKIYLIGGTPDEDESAHDVVLIYDIVAETYTPGASMPEARTQFGATLGPDCLIYIVGGKTDYYNMCLPLHDDVFIYDPQTDTWVISQSNFPIPTGELSLLACDDLLYALGGWVDDGDPVAVPDVYTMEGQVPACTNQNISLNEICNTEVLPNMVLSPAVNCPDLYEVIIFDEYGVPRPDNFVNAGDIGNSYEYEIRHVNIPFACSGIITVEDKFEPQITCRDTVVNCLDMLTYPGPIAEDNCGNAYVELLNEVPTVLQCEEYVKEILMTYVATDASGNTSQVCNQTVRVKRVEFDSLEYPEHEVILECDDINEFDDEGNPAASLTGIPTLYGHQIYPFNDFLCNVTVEYSDYTYPKVACTQEIIRSWEIIEWWCSEKIRAIPFHQRILIIDTTAPEITLPRDMTVNTDRRTCSALVDLPAAMVNDACNNPASVTTKTPFQAYPGMNGPVVELPVGIHKIYYEAFDACYKKSVDSIYVTVMDQNPPVAVCEQHLAVSLQQGGFATAPATSFDDGSYDPCGLDTIQVRRMADNCGVPGNTDWGAEVSFCCEDVGENVMVALLVRDLSGREGQCMVVVNVQDKLPPSLIPLPDMSITCEYAIDTTRLFEFGKIALDPADREEIIASNMEATFSGNNHDGLAMDNCGLAVSEDFDLNVDNCGLGLLRRFFTITDPQGFQILDTQYVHLVDRDPFDSTDFVWPADLDTIDMCNSDQLHPDSLPERYSRPRITGDDACSLIGVTYQDVTLPVTRGDTACLKILRTWKIIDWCQKENGVFRRWQREQILKFRNETPPTILSTCNDTIVSTFDPQCQEGYIELIAEGMDDCTPVDELYWTFRIDEFDDGSIDTSGIGNDASGHYPVGIHRISWFLEDRCGNSTRCDYTFEIRNDKGPVVYCRNGLIAALEGVDLDNDGNLDDEQVVIYPENIDLGSYHTCGYMVTLSFDQAGMVDSIVYDCDSIGLRPVEMWVTDINGNQGSCLVNVEVVDTNMVNICPAMNPLVSITGKLITRTGAKIENAIVSLSGSGLPEYITDNTGAYAFPGMRTGGNYELYPEKTDDVLNGVSTKDLIMIQRHLLGTQTLDNPYAMIAADINKSGGISAKDLTELRKTILGIQPFFTNNTSWRFVKSAYQFPDPTDPWRENFPEFEEIGNLTQDMVIDFTGIKIGDVDESFALRSGTTQSRSSEGAVTLELRPAIHSPEYGWVVPVYLKTDVEIAGLQFDLEVIREFQKIRSVIPADLWMKGSAMLYESMVGSGTIRGSWTSENLFSGEQLLLYIQLSSVGFDHSIPEIEISRKYMQSEAYSADLSPYPIALKIVRTEMAPLAMSVSPNPWSDLLQINIANGVRGKGTLMMFDQNGKQVWQRQETIVTGDLETWIRRMPDWKAGTYHLSFTQNNERETITIILTE